MLSLLPGTFPSVKCHYEVCVRAGFRRSHIVESRDWEMSKCPWVQGEQWPCRQIKEAPLGPVCVWFQVYIWVLNDEEDFQRAFDLGATGVMTDFPTRLKDFMDRNGMSKLQWPPRVPNPPSFIDFYYYLLKVCSALTAHTQQSNHNLFNV